MNNLYKKANIKILGYLVLVIVILSGCKEDFLEENPHSQLSEATFWKTQEDAERALVGCYRLVGGGWWSGLSGWNVYQFIGWGHRTDLGRASNEFGKTLGTEYSPTSLDIESLWKHNYTKISRANYFLENIDKVNMDDDKKREMIAQVRTLRGYAYFLLSQYFGGVPLIKKVLTFDEANCVLRNSKEEVVSFILDELTEAANDLPTEWPSAEKGKVEKGTALAIKGRLLMSENRWSEAAGTYKQIIDLDRYIIDPRYKELFEDEGDDSDEIIFHLRFLQNIYTEIGVTQVDNVPDVYGGYNNLKLFQNFVDEFWMIDGESIENSSLYDPENPFENRDPRLYATIFLPGYTFWRGKIFQAHPDSTIPSQGVSSSKTGYCLKKFADENYDGGLYNYGGDFKLIRYAEVLLSYLESKLEAGDPVDQVLLDETINKVRSREAVNMPPVNETNPDNLRKIIRRERIVELGCEGGIRHWDIYRWRIAHEVLNRNFYGMKITDDPENYTEQFIINEDGYVYNCKKTFHEYNYLWPIPLSEIDINKTLEQNPGY